MADIRQIAQDPDFRKLPVSEQVKAFSEYDKDFAALPPAEQIKGVNELVNGVTPVKGKGATGDFSTPPISTGASFFEGLKHGINLTALGGFQGVMQGGQWIRDKLGMDSNQANLDALQGLIDEKRKEYASTGVNAQHPLASGTGEFLGGTLPTLALPGGAEKSLVQRLLSSLIQGGIIGGAQPTSGNESRGTNIAIGAGLGAAGQGLVSTIGKGVNALRGTVTKSPVQQLGDQFNIPTTLGEDIGKPFTQWVETMQEKIPWLGIGKFRARQNEAAGNAATDLLAQHAVGTNPADSMVANREFASKLYDDMKTLLPGISAQQIVPGKTKPLAAAFLKRYPDLFKRFQDTKTEGLLQDIAAGVKDVTKNTPASTILNASGNPMVEAAVSTTPKTLTFDEAWALRQGLGEKISQARKMLQRGEIDQTAYGQLKSMFGAVSSDMESWASKIGKPEITDAFRASNDAYKNYVVKYDVLQRAYDKAAGPNETVGRMFSPQKFSTALTQIIQKDKHLNLFSPGEISEMSGLANIMQVVRRAGQYMENPPTGARLTLPILGATAENIALHLVGTTSATATGGVAVVGTAVAKFLTSTRTGKNLARAASKVEASTPAMQKIVDEIFKLIPKAASVEATQPNSINEGQQ